MDGYGSLAARAQPLSVQHQRRRLQALADDIHRPPVRRPPDARYPRAAVEKNPPVFGTQFTARDIADTTSTQPLNPDMYGVDMPPGRPGPLRQRVRAVRVLGGPSRWTT